MEPKNTVNKILHTPEVTMSRIRGAQGFLSRMFIQICADLRIKPMRWGKLMSDYVADPRNHTDKSQESLRGNMTKQLTGSRMTWRNFIRALRWLQFTQINIIIEARHRNGTVTNHYGSINLGTYEPEDASDEDEEAEAKSDDQIVNDASDT